MRSHTTQPDQTLGRGPCAAIRRGPAEDQARPSGPSQKPCRRLNVMVVKGNYGRTGGAETLLAALLRHLDLNRLNPSLVKLTHDMDYRLPGLENAAAYGIAERNILWRNYGSAGPALREAREYVQSADIDVVYTHDMRADLLGYALNRTIGLPWLAHLHGWLGRTAHLKNRLHEWIDRRLLARADMVVVGSEQLRSSVERRCRCKTVRVVPNYVDPDSIAVDPTRVRAVREQLNVSSRQTLVGTVARLHRGKGHQVLLRAIAQIRRSDPTIRCVIVGEGGYRSALERLADDLRIADIVTFAGFRPDVTPYVAALDIFVTCSFTESLPVNVLEAMLLARPIVATDVGDVARVLDGGKAGVLLKPRRADETAQAIKQLLAQPQRRKQLAEEGRRRVLTHYSVARAAKQIEALLIATSRWQGAKIGRGLPC